MALKESPILFLSESEVTLCGEVQDRYSRLQA